MNTSWTSDLSSLESSGGLQSAAVGFGLHSAVIESSQQFVNVKASHSPGRQLLLVESSQSLGGTVEDLPPAHARHGQVPLTLVQVGSTALEKLAHGDQQTGPAQVVVGGGEGLSLEQPQEEQQLA